MSESIAKIEERFENTIFAKTSERGRLSICGSMVPAREG